MIDLDIYLRDLVKKSNDKILQTAILRSRREYLTRRDKNLRRLKNSNININIKDRVEELKAIRRANLERIPELIGVAKEAMEDHGMRVHIARDSVEANKIVADLCGNEGWNAELVVKAKSITSEEIELNKHLAECTGITVWETDVGALLLQLMDGKAMHPTGVSIAVPSDVAAEYFSKLAGRRLPPDPQILVAFVREFIREKIMNADVGITGANAITADTGSIYLLENEGNIRLVTSIPEKQIVLTGIEKIMPNRDAADLYVQVMPVYTTGAEAITYLNIIGGISVSSDIERISVRPASGPDEIDVILLDNGRLELLKDHDFREILTCLKCGACLMECPLWNIVAGYFGEHVYMGGFGTIFTAFTKGLEAAVAQAFTCTLCGKCKDICPMGIDVPEMIRKLRQRIVEEGIARPHERIASNARRTFNPYGEDLSSCRYSHS